MRQEAVHFGVINRVAAQYGLKEKKLLPGLSSLIVVILSGWED